MTRSSGTAERAGAGSLLWIALTFLGTLSVVGVVQHTFARQVTTSVERGIAGDLAGSLAASALEEAMHRNRIAANDPASPLFYTLRRPVSPPDPGAVKLTRDLKLQATPALLEREPFQNFSFSSPKVEILYRHPCDRDRYESFGLIHYATRATGAVGSSDTVVRELHAYQELKTVLITTPRPFDQMPFYVGRASAMTDQAKVNRLRVTILDLHRQARTALQRVIDATSGKTKDEYLAMLAKTDTPERAAACAPALDEDPTSHVTAVWMSGQKFVMDVIDLARKLQETVPVVEAAVRRELAAADAAASSPGSESAQRGMKEAATSALSLVSRELLRIWSFSRAFQFIPPAAAEYAQFESVAATRLSYEHFRRTAFFVLRETSPGQPPESLQAQWERLRRRASTTPGQIDSLSGVVLIENGSERVTLRGDLHGKLIVVTLKGGLTLTDVNPKATAEDSLVAVCLGGTIEMSGTVNAAVIAAPYRDGDRERLPGIVAAPGTAIHGGLYVATSLARAEWHGLLTYDDRYFGGPDLAGGPAWPSHYYVGLAPLPLFQTVSRK